MRPLNPGEIELLANTLKHLVGARFQKVLSSKEDVILEFWLKGETYYLWFNDSPLRPYLTFWPESLPFQIKKKPLPLALFLNANIVNRTLTDVEYPREYGRLLILRFGEDHRLEFRIFPHGQNILAEVLGKSISLHKPSPLQILERMDQSFEIRSVFDFSNEWKLSKNPIKKALKVKSNPVESSTQESKFVKKLKSAILKVEAELERKKELKWKEAGEHLKSIKNLDGLDIEFEPYVDRKRSLAWNLNHCFEQAKETKRKIQGTIQRLDELRKQLKEPEKDSTFPQERKLKEKVDHVRSFKVREGVRALCGRSAKENLTLLRQAKTWDLWIHLKDLPSSHAIVFRPKNQSLSPSEMESVVQWFFKQTLGKKFASKVGERFDVVIAECRHVKPIKGDRIGRVHYQNEKVLRFTVKA